MKVYFDTFGCRLNKAEALEMEARFLAAGWLKASSHSDANLIIVRGCSVTHRAERDSEKLLAHLRSKYPFKRIFATGCMAGAVKDPAAMVIKNESASRAVPSSTARAYLKIQDGCNSRCAFCIVPRFRGTAFSVPFRECLDKAKAFADAGYREIVVTGCNLAQYLSEGHRLPEILAALAGVDPSVRIRLGSLEPGTMAKEIVGLAAGNPNICPYFHFSVQSGSQHILAAMNRGYTPKDVDETLSLVEEKIPFCGIGADFITGFPGESDFDFLASSGLVKRHAFNRLHVFPYSERPGTKAATMPGVVPKELRRARARSLAMEGYEKRSEFAKSFLGKTVEIVVETTDGIAGWTAERVWCEAKEVLQTGKISRRERVKVSVRSVKDHVLSGVVLR